MAGNGPAPKPPDQRRRRNKPERGEWVVLPGDGYDGPEAPMPELETDHARYTWGLWWSSPMAHMWTEADWPALQRLIVMIDSGREKANEIRLQEERFGLSPKGRRDLRWVLPVEEETAAPKGVVLEGRWSDLRVVEDG